MGVNWSKDIDQTLAAAKEQFPSHLAGFQRGSGLRSMCSAGGRVLCRSEDCRIHSREFPFRQGSHKGTPGVVPPLCRGLDADCALAR